MQPSDVAMNSSNVPSISCLKRPNPKFSYTWVFPLTRPKNTLYWKYRHFLIVLAQQKVSHCLPWIVLKTLKKKLCKYLHLKPRYCLFSPYADRLKIGLPYQTSRQITHLNHIKSCVKKSNVFIGSNYVFFFMTWSYHQVYDVVSMLLGPNPWVLPDHPFSPSKNSRDENSRARSPIFLPNHPFWSSYFGKK